jgi:hypothetical protein
VARYSEAIGYTVSISQYCDIVGTGAHRLSYLCCLHYNDYYFIFAGFPQVVGEITVDMKTGARYMATFSGAAGGRRALAVIRRKTEATSGAGLKRSERGNWPVWSESDGGGQDTGRRWG